MNLNKKSELWFVRLEVENWRQYNGKHVITANKALIAKHGNKLIQSANKNKVRLLFEASVAGGIPIIKSLEQGLSANKIESLAGIINGTGNFILTEMKEKGRDFDDVLKEAQALGYAEADPTFDVEYRCCAQIIYTCSNCLWH